MQVQTRRRVLPVYVATAALLVASLFASCALGSSHVPLQTVVGVLGQQLLGLQDMQVTASEVYIVWGLRLPRAILAVGVGGGLAVAGAAMQSVTRNVMADPYTLGISSGALAFVGLGFLLGGSLALTGWFIPLLAFLGAIVSLVLVFAVGGAGASSSPTKLVLSGMAVSITLNALAQFCIYNDQNSNGASSIVNWMMGSLGSARWDGIWLPLVGCVLGGLYFVMHARSFDLMALGDETAISLGTNTKALKACSMAVVAVIAGLSVASCGIIGLVGFMIPHIVRFLVGTEHLRTFPMSFTVGAIFMVWMDILARVIMAPQELPVGILTAMCGGPYFIWLLRRQKSRG